MSSMLSRVADSLYWMSRYLERAEHMARVVGIHVEMSLEQPDTDSPVRWIRVLDSVGASASLTHDGTPHGIARALVRDHAQSPSIVSNIMAARENARQVREQISSEMWEELNRLFHEVKRVALLETTGVSPHEFLEAVKAGSHMFQGLTDSTMNHGEGWHFIQLGRFIERARMLATLIDVHYRDLAHDSSAPIDPGDHLEWIGLIKSCTAFEAYCKVYNAELRPDRILEFLLLSPEFPHSVRFSVDAMQASLTQIGNSTKLTRLAGKLRASLSFSQVDEVFSSGLHTYLDGVQRQCAGIHNAIRQVYVSYPIETAIED